jgi:hypothetical protein
MRGVDKRKVLFVVLFRILIAFPPDALAFGVVYLISFDINLDAGVIISVILLLLLLNERKVILF